MQRFAVENKVRGFEEWWENLLSYAYGVVGLLIEGKEGETGRSK